MTPTTQPIDPINTNAAGGPITYQQFAEDFFANNPAERLARANRAEALRQRYREQLERQTFEHVIVQREAEVAEAQKARDAFCHPAHSVRKVGSVIVVLLFAVALVTWIAACLAWHLLAALFARVGGVTRRFEIWFDEWVDSAQALTVGEWFDRVFKAVLVMLTLALIGICFGAVLDGRLEGLVR